MDCLPVHELILDEESRQGVQRIRQIQRLSQALAGGLTLGTLATIFVRSNSLEATYNISSTNWEAFARAMRGIPEIKQNRIRQVARSQMLRHSTQHKQRLFWKGVLNGCSPR